MPIPAPPVVWPEPSHQSEPMPTRTRTSAEEIL
jgi:hypothetical protein